MAFRILAAAAAVAFAGPASAATELVTNGGFETGDLTGWSLSPLDPVNIFVDPFTSRTGTFSFSAGNNYAGTLSQSVSTVAGETYAYSFAIRDSAGVVPGTLTVSLGGAQLAPIDGDDYREWTLFSGLIVAGADNAVLSFNYAEVGRGIWYLDDVSLVSTGAVVPEPATWAMLIVGFGLVGGVMRRRPEAATGSAQR